MYWSNLNISSNVMLLSALGARLLGKLFAGKGTIRVGEGTMKVSEGTIRAGQDL